MFHYRWADSEFLPITMNSCSLKESPLPWTPIGSLAHSKPQVEHMYTIHCWRCCKKWLAPSTTPVSIWLLLLCSKSLIRLKIGAGAAFSSLSNLDRSIYVALWMIIFHPTTTFPQTKCCKPLLLFPWKIFWRETFLSSISSKLHSKHPLCHILLYDPSSFLSYSMSKK